MQEKGNIWFVVLAIVAVAGIAGAAYFYGQNQNLKGITHLASSTPFVIDSAVPNESTVPSPSATPSAAKVTVVFEAEGSFTAAEKTELQKKVIDPFTDYYLEPGSSTQKLLTLTISKNNQASKDTYPYQAQAIFDGGGNMGFLIMKVGAGVDWWYPECMISCNLSAAYKAKYPEIAAKVQ